MSNQTAEKINGSAESLADANIQLPIYLDNQATTMLDSRVLDAMMPYLTQKFGNPHSRNHRFGWEAEDAVEKARAQVADIIGADKREIIFTSGATESNNLALKGVARFYKDQRNHIVTVTTEHKCVLDSCRHLEQEGFEVTYLPVPANGIIELAQLEAALTERTILVSVMAVNNEIGVIQPLAEIGALCRQRKIFFHTDAAQAVGKIPLDVKEMNIDLMSISGHKIYGPMGVGALYVGRKPRVRMQALFSGGGQERGMRSGTLSPALCVGIGEACAIGQVEMAEETARIAKLSDKFQNTIQEQLDDVFLNGDAEQRYKGNLNLSFAFVEGESMMMGLKDLAISSGSACTSASLEPSYVLRALGVDVELAHTSIRFGLGRFTTEAEIDYAAEAVIERVRKLRAMSPLWEMVQEGIDLKSIEWSEH